MANPSLRSLQVFEVAARLQNFRAAADALFLTHGAVSRQVRALEAELGVDLFTRSGRRIFITPDGQQLQAAVAEALRVIQSATERISTKGEKPSGRVAVTVLPSLAARWLLPRLVQFQASYPDIAVDIVSTTDVLDLSASQVNLAIRYGAGRWPGMLAERLACEYLFPVAAPGGVLGRCALPKTPSEMLDYPLLDPGKEWQQWFRRAGVIAALDQVGMAFNDASLLLQAAERGQGIALARKCLVTDALAAGQLVRLPGPRMRSPYAYYLVRDPAVEPSPEVLAFMAWIRQAMREGASL